MTEPKNTGGVASILESSQAPTMFTRGGTTTTAWDNEIKRQLHDSAERRRIQDAKAAAARQSIANPDPLEVARMNTLKLGGHSDHAVIVLELRHRDGSVQDWEVCELSVIGGSRVGVQGANTSDDAGFSLTMVCPRCVLTRGRKMELSQLTLRSTQKRMSFRPNVVPKWMRSASNLWVNPNQPGEVYQVAGSVDCDELCVCDHEGCGFRFKIDDSVVVS